jgi:hypothetical protein
LCVVIEYFESGDLKGKFEEFEKSGLGLRENVSFNLIVILSFFFFFPIVGFEEALAADGNCTESPSRWKLLTS